MRLTRKWVPHVFALYTPDFETVMIEFAPQSEAFFV